MQWRWISSHGVERIEASFHAFYILITAPGYSEADCEVLQKQLVAGSQDKDIMTFSTGVFLQRLMVYVLKINEIYTGNATTWDDANVVTYPAYFTGFTTATAPAPAPAATE